MDTPRPTNPPDPELVQAIYAVGQTYWLSYNLCIRIADACEAWLGERLAVAERENAEKDALLARADNLLGHASHSDSRCEPPDGRSMESWCSVCSWREDLAAASPLPDTGDYA